MFRMARFFLALMMTAFLAWAPPALAAEPERKTESPEELLGDAARSLMRAIEMMLMAIPQYAAPEVLENGDIIIRRKPSAPSAPKVPPEEKAPRHAPNSRPL